MDHNHPRHHHHPHHQPRHHQQPPPRHLNSPSRYLPLHPHPPPPPPPSFPENHPSFFPPQHHPNFTFINSPPHHQFHHHDDVIYRSPPSRAPPPPSDNNRLQFYDSHNPNPSHNHGDVLPPRFRLNELPPHPHPPPPPPPLPSHHHHRVPPISPVARRSPSQFVQFDRFGRQFDEDLNLDLDLNSRVRLPQQQQHQHNDSIDFQFRVDDEVDDRRIEYDRDWERNRDERYYSEMMRRRSEFEANSSNNEYDRLPMNDEGLIRGGRRDSGSNLGFEEKNLSKRYAGGVGGGREVSRSPIKFRIGAVEGDDRFSSRGRKEEVQEFNNRVIPRKNVQKKSAFLRIQPGKPQHYSGSGSSNFRNRFDSGTGSSGNSPHKGNKESNSEFVDNNNRISEERVGSPVELDVSFKSNALVAKAIMAAPSCSGVEVNVNNAVSGSGTSRMESEIPAKVTSHKLKSVVSVKEDKEKESKSRVKVSPIRKKVGNQSTVGEVRGSESSPGGSSSVSGGVARKVSSKGKVLVKDDKNAGLRKVASPVVRKKRKAISQLSRLSNNPVPSKTDSELVNVDGSVPCDVSVKQSDEALNVTASPQNEFVDIVGTFDINDAPTVVEKEDIVGQSVSEASPPKGMRETEILESFLDESRSLGSEVSEGDKNTKVFLKDEQRSLNPDEDVTKSVEKCSSENHSEKDSVKGKEMAAVFVNNCSVEGSSELGRVCTGDNLDNDICSGSVDAVNSVPVMSFIVSADHVTNKIKDEVDLTCGIVDGDEPCETKVLSSPENTITGLSLGGLYTDKVYEPEVRHSQHNAMLLCSSSDADKPCQTQVCSSPENVNVGLSLGGLYSDRNNETELGRFEDIAKVGSFSNDESGDKKRTSCSYDDDVTADLENNDIVPDGVTNDIQEQQYQGLDAMLGDNDSLLGRDEVPTTCISPFTVKEDNFQVKRKRKPEIEVDSLGTRVYETCHESVVSLSFSVENAMLPVEKCCSAAAEQPCVEPDGSNGNENAGGCVKGMNSLNYLNDLDKIEYSSCSGKKRKILPEKSAFCDVQSSDLPASTMTLTPVADGASARFFPQFAEGFELHKSIITGEDAAGSAIDSLCAEVCSYANNSKSDFLCKESCSSATESAPPDAEQSYLPEAGCSHEINKNLVMAEVNDEYGVIALELTTCSMATSDGNSGLPCLSADHTMDVDQGHVAISMKSDDNKMATTDKNSSFLCWSTDRAGDVNPEPFINMECDDNRIAANTGNSVLPSLLTDHSRDVDEGSITANMECDGNISLNANSSSLSGCLQSGAESTDDGVTINCDLLDVPSNAGCLGDSSLVSPTSDTSNARPAIHVNLGEQLSIDDKVTNQSSATQSSIYPKVNVIPESYENNSMPTISASLAVQPLARKSVPLPSKNIKTTLSRMSRLRSNVLTRSEATPSTSQRTPVVNPSKNTHTYQAKPRTWHRADNLPASNVLVKKPAVGTPLHKPLYGKPGKVQDTSYIRKGNSLVRNPVSGADTSGSRAIGASNDQSKPNDSYRIRKVVGPVIPEPTELPDGLVTGGRSTPIENEMPNTPPLSCSGKTPDNDVVYSGECASSLPIDQSEGTDNEETIKSSDSRLNASGDPESVANTTLEDPGVLSDGDLLGSCSKRMVYIKRKSNQLIAASKSSQLSVHNMGKAAALSSDKNYYKRRKNQLIRASSDGNIQQMVAVMNGNSKALSGRVRHAYSGRSSTKRPSNKVKSTKFSLVWKLGDSKSSGKGVDALRSGRLLSHLLPWKRTTYWSRKLLSSRKRGAVYVRSGHGFSLRRSKVTSLPGTSLKWSKSMEKRSKKVKEDAALAVAALDSVQKSGSSGVTSKAASSLHSLHKVGHGLKLHPGERIYRIGVFRYRMDPSRRTLQRISDEEASDFTASKTEKDVRKTYVPKRLLIGTDEYVRIGNGNQLVRDPKRRTRILANEKVRWSLHTARMRLAKKRKFCQFFTRFGKCNKGEGKCPFIHDPSKIAVCTKFLNGLCADQNCKLTHEVIPERMPDCSFYLQGLCSNEKCPYRHVNVNPKASICENFLRGYCAEGNECRKKHSYICPEFEASGSCPQGLKCKLYHPKKVKSKKRKVSRYQNNAEGRYFGSDLSVVADPESRPLLEKPVEPNNGNLSVEGDLGDFISLDVSDNETLENGLTSDLTEDDPLDLHLDYPDEMIKPLSILGAL